MSCKIKTTVGKTSRLDVLRRKTNAHIPLMFCLFIIYFYIYIYAKKNLFILNTFCLLFLSLFIYKYYIILYTYKKKTINQNIIKDKLLGVIVFKMNKVV